MHSQQIVARQAGPRRLKTRPVALLLAGWLVVGSIFASTFNQAPHCTRAQSLDQMIALNQYGAKLLRDMPNPTHDPEGYEQASHRVSNFGARLAAIGKILAEGRYDDACRTYDELAKEYAAGADGGS